MKKKEHTAEVKVDTVILDKDGVQAVLVGTLTVESKHPIEKVDFSSNLTVTTR